MIWRFSISGNGREDMSGGGTQHTLLNLREKERMGSWDGFLSTLRDLESMVWTR